MQRKSGACPASFKSMARSMLMIELVSMQDVILAIAFPLIEMPNT
jgi:hypothetical protein